MTQYFTTDPGTQFLDLYANARDRERIFARFRLPSCKYTFGCRTVGLTIYGAVQIMDLEADVEYELTAVTGQRANVAVVSNTKWSNAVANSKDVLQYMNLRMYL